MDLKKYSVLERNILLEWQWVKKKHFYVMQYPVDIDILTFNSITSAAGYRTSTINLTISNFESCTLQNLTSEVEHVLWRDIFLNDTDSYLCTRTKSDDNFKKTFMFYSFMVWVGYDLSCSINKEHIAYEAVKKETSPLEITLVCVLLSLFHPLIFYLIESESLSNKIKQLPQPFVNEDLTEYRKSDTPFGLQRALLKLFYFVKIGNHKVEQEGNIYWKMSKTYVTNIAACRLTTVYFCVLVGFSIARFILSYNNHIAYEDIYRLGIPFLNSSCSFTWNCSVYFAGLLLGAVLLKQCYTAMSSKEQIIKANKIMTTNTLLYYEFFLPLHQSACQRGQENASRVPDSEETRCNQDDKKEIRSWCCIPAKEFVYEDDQEDNQRKFVSQFVERFVILFSHRYWATLWKNSMYCCFTCPGKTICDILVCFFRKSLFGLLLIPFVVFNVLTGMFPLLWIIFHFPYVFTMHFIHGRTCCESSRPKTCCKCIRCFFVPILFVLIYMIAFAVFIFSQWILLSANIFVLRSLLFLTFVELSSSSHFLRVFLVIVITIGYVASFLHGFIKEHSIILKVISDEKKQILVEELENKFTKLESEMEERKQKLQNGEEQQKRVYKEEIIKFENKHKDSKSKINIEI